MLHSLVRAPGKRQQWAKKYKQALHKRGSKEASFWNVSTEQQLKAGRLKYMKVSRGWAPLPALAGGSPVGCPMEDWVCTAQGDVCGFALWRKDGIGPCVGDWRRMLSTSLKAAHWWTQALCPAWAGKWHTGKKWLCARMLRSCQLTLHSASGHNGASAC